MKTVGADADASPRLAAERHAAAANGVTGEEFDRFRPIADTDEGVRERQPWHSPPAFARLCLLSRLIFAESAEMGLRCCRPARAWPAGHLATSVHVG
jgi:hypothetical protein